MKGARRPSPWHRKTGLRSATESCSHPEQPWPQDVSSLMYGVFIIRGLGVFGIGGNGLESYGPHLSYSQSYVSSQKDMGPISRL